MSELFTPIQAREQHPILAFFARRPVTVSVLLLATGVLGLISMNLMPIELFPAGFESKSLSVEVPYNKAGDTVSPLTVEREVTLPVEAELSTIPGIQDLSAVSRRDGAEFDLEFDGERDMDEAYAEIMAAVERARLRLPTEVGRIQVRRFRGGSGAIPVAWVNFYWEDDTVDPHLLLEKVIQPYLESIDGVASVNFMGGNRKFIAVDLDPEKTRAYGINLAELLQRLRGDNFRAPAGKTTVRHPLDAEGRQVQEREVYLVADSRFHSIEEIENLPVRPGLRLADITRHSGDNRGVYETYGVSQYVHVNGRDGATCTISKTGDANTVTVGNRIEAALKDLQTKPQMKGFSVRTAWNQGDSIKESIANLMETLAWGGLLAFIVLLVFLKSWRLALVIALSIPLSMTLTLAVMFLMDQTINLLTLMGFTLAGGMLLDNSIVVAENVYRRHGMGEQPEAAVVRGAGEVGLALILATGTTVIVFISVVFLAGEEFVSFIMGKIGLPVCLSLAFSIVLAIGVIPMTMQRAGLLRAHQSSRVRRWFSGLRARLDYRWRERKGAARLLLLPGITAWEAVALFAGRNAEGVPASPVIDRLEVWYGRLVRRLMPSRWLTVPLVLVATIALFLVISSAMEKTDQNQGNRDRISLRARFPAGSDIMINRRALLVTEIAKGSAAERARMRVGDYVLGYNRSPVGSLEELERLSSAAPRGAPIQIDLARGSATGSLEIEGGPTGIHGDMQDTQPLRDAIALRYVLEVEEILLGDKHAREKRDRAVAKGISEEIAKATYGRTPEEAKDEFGVETLIVNFSASSARFQIFVVPERVAESGRLYKNILAAMPERAGVEMSGQFEGGSSATSEVSIRINGPDTEKLLLLAEEISVRLQGVEGLEGVQVDAEEGLDEVTVGVDRQRAAAMGVEPGTLSQVLAFQLSGTTLRDFQQGENLVPLRVRFAPPEDSQGHARDPNLQDVAETRVFTGAGGNVAAKAVTKSSGLAKSGLGEIRRRNRQTSLRVVGTTSTEDLQRIRTQVNYAMEGVKFPPGYTQELGGRFGDFQARFDELGRSTIWAGLLVFLVMCFLFESFLKPVCILVISVPGALLGGYGALWLSSTPFDVMTGLGLVVLIGVVVNNGIVLVDLINRLRADGMPREQAVHTGAAQRMRPILLTSLTTAFGLIPMAIGDSKFVGMPYYPMGRMVLGGILVSMLYTLVLVPMLYTMLDDIGWALKYWTRVLLGARDESGSADTHGPVSAD
ncbi:MAG: efflux RND transporter permease subunit [Planctomycetes bacterium]|nr:efflux RND transporter permease subunit [Planctomycetota bacterium]MCB9935591.1 efflux RND transporter permease subunit [Planctomycetota bacterium]